jgi:hypothetical protein
MQEDGDRFKSGMEAMRFVATPGRAASLENETEVEAIVAGVIRFHETIQRSFQQLSIEILTSGWCRENAR